MDLFINSLLDMAGWGTFALFLAANAAIVRAIWGGPTS